MKVLQINVVCGIGSTGRIVADLYRYLTDRGHMGIVGYGRGEVRNCDSVIRIGAGWDTYRHVAAARLLDRSGFCSKSATKRFIKQIKAVDPDIIHLHNIHGYYLHVGELFAYLKEAGKPVVWTLHDCWPFTGHCAYFEYAGCDRWMTGCHDCPQKKPYPSRWWRDASLKNYEEKKNVFTNVKNLTIITPSRWLAGKVEQSFLSEYPVRVIPNGVDLQVFRPAESDFRRRYNMGARDFVVLGVAGVWEERKGLSCFIQLAKKMKSLKQEYRFVLVGVSAEQREALPPGVIGIARTENAGELARIYSAADVFVNTTLEDNFPTTNLESLACGTPVITFQTGGSVESVRQDTGIVVKKGDVAALEKAVTIVRSRTKAFYTEACVRSAKTEYDKENTYAEYMKLYQAVSGGRV